MPILRDVSRLSSFDPSTARPRTAPPASQQHVSADTAQARNHARSSSGESPGGVSAAAAAGNSGVSKYEMLENRPIKPMQNRMSANYPPLSPKISPKAGGGGGEPIGRPTPSDLTPKPHQRKRSASPVTRAINFADDSESDVKAADLKAIKAYLMSGKMKSKTSGGGKPLEGQHHHSGGGGGGSTVHRIQQQYQQQQQQQYSPNKYTTPTRKEVQSAHAASATHAQTGGSDVTSLLSSAHAGSSPSSVGHSPSSTAMLTSAGGDHVDSPLGGNALQLPSVGGWMNHAMGDVTQATDRASTSQSKDFLYI